MRVAGKSVCEEPCRASLPTNRPANCCGGHAQRRPAAFPHPSAHRRFFEGGNDYEIYSHTRTKGHAIEDANPMTTLKKLSELFGVPCPASLTPPGAH